MDRIEFDMRQQTELNNWMSQTIQYALVGGGKDEVGENEIVDILKEIVVNLPSQRHKMSEIAVPVLRKARELLGEEKEQSSEDMTDYYVPVMQWALKSAAVFMIARGRPFDHEKLEAIVADKITDGIQGNRSHKPTRIDLDKVVRKTIEFGLETLDSVAA